MKVTSLGRREFLRWSALAGASTLAAACAPKVVEKVVKETVVVEKEVMKEVPKEVIVKETVIVAGTPKVVEKAVTTTPAPSIKGQVDIWVYPLTENDNEVIYDPLMVLFHQEYPDIETNIDVQPWGGRREKLYAAFAANEAPDIWYANTDTLPAYRSKGVALDLNEVLSPEDLAPHDLASLEAGVYKGMRLLFNNYPFVYGYGYNSELMTACGVDPTVGVKTWQEMYDLAETAKSNGWYVYEINTLSWGNWVVDVHRASGQVFSDDGTKVDMLQEACVDTLTHYVKMFNSDYVPLEGAVATPEQGASIPDYFSEKLQVMGNSSDAWCANIKRQFPDFPYIIGQPVARREGDPLTSGNISGAGWAITARAPHPEEAVIWVKWMIRPENLGLCNTLGARPAPKGESWKYLKLEDCVMEWMDRQYPYGFVSIDLYTLWQEAKTLSAPHFQGAILGQETIEEALEKSQEEMQTTLDEKIAAGE